MSTAPTAVQTAAQTAAELLERDPKPGQRVLAWELPRPLPCVLPRWGRELPPRVQAWAALAPALDGPRSGPAQRVAKTWPVVGERSWPHAWVERACGSESPPSAAALACADTIDLSSARPKLKVGQLRKLVRQGPLDQVRSLWMYCCPTKGKWLGDLAASPQLGQLLYLNVHGNNIDAAAAKALLGSTQLGALERLDLGFNAIRGRLRELFEALADGGLPALASLRLRTNGLRAPDFDALAESAAVPASLRCLDIGGSKLDASGLGQLVERWPVLDQLEHLDISVTQIGDEGLELLAGSGRVAKLRSLACSGALTGTGATGVRALLASPNLPALRSLDLSNIRLGERMPEAWAGSEVGARLTRVILQGCGIADEQLQAMLPDLAALEELGLAHNRTHAVAIVSLIEACPRLRRLDVSSNSFDEDGARALLSSAAVAQLDWLELSFFGDRADNPARAELAALAAERGVTLSLR